MTYRVQPSRDADLSPRARRPRHRAERPVGRRQLFKVWRVVAVVTAVAVVTTTGIGWASYRNVVGGITTSNALAGGPASTGGEQNILIMGLDSRLDQHGQPLPEDIYSALHAGDETVGGYNANVLILLHLPGGDGPITAVSIPRDNFVDLPGCPAGQCKRKIKEAYGLAYQQTMETLANSQSESATGAYDPMANEQTAREAGRKSQIAAVRQLLGVPVDHFVEITMAAFFQIARVVEPITVCLNADTVDDYSGANFHQGEQLIDASQAMAFVRQRRDLNDELFTDLDRTRRQQAFIVSLVSALRQGGALSNPANLSDLLQVAQKNLAVDAGFKLAGFLGDASSLTSRQMSLYTLPIGEFGQDPAGSDVNIVDVATIRTLVHDLFAGTTDQTSTTPTSPAPLASPAILNVVNATTVNGLAAAVTDWSVTRGFTPGESSTADALSPTSTLHYGSGAEQAAQALAAQLKLTATASDAVAPDTVELVLGSDFPAADYLITPASPEHHGPSASPLAMTAVDATSTGDTAPAPTDFTKMTATNIPCVR
ncbi:LCP family protein [Mycolicibacterium sp. YH-1]|uniref:LCP family protein n=1 Tax=Mycolicibacterium sp. YH-1 TaxID=2908837 RepID=UPI001F4C0FFB|nr:LCP family protein [Mycolicibacterium sp. YH-1]UNB52725.1 LCP family protein [Mycolicibacterium sp. YH-1]